MDLHQLSPREYEKILGVFKRDLKLRSAEEARICQLKEELSYLRRRAALKPGIDPVRSCARCLNQLGRILNRGALCPVCHKKVCKECRQYGDENHNWLCIFCYKEMQLKAVSGEWMYEENKQSNRRCAKDPIGDIILRVLCESQKKGLLHGADISQENKSLSELSDTSSTLCKNSSQNIPTHLPPSQMNDSRCTPEPKPLVHSPTQLVNISPWSGIDPEPTIPVRLSRSRPFSLIAHCDSLEPGELRHATGYRSRSTSSDEPVHNQPIDNPHSDTADTVPSPTKAAQLTEIPQSRPLNSHSSTSEISFSENEDDSRRGKKSGLALRKLTVKKKSSLAALDRQSDSISTESTNSQPVLGLKNKSFNNLSSKTPTNAPTPLSNISQNRNNRKSNKRGKASKKCMPRVDPGVRDYSNACATPVSLINTEAQSGTGAKEKKSSWNEDLHVPNLLFRSASLPMRKRAILDLPQPWFWRCHSMEDWLWEFDIVPYQYKNSEQIVRPDNYKLVYVSSESEFSDAEENSKSHLRVHSRIETNQGTSYIEDSDWEIGSNSSEELDGWISDSKVEANNFLVKYRDPMDVVEASNIGAPVVEIDLDWLYLKASAAYTYAVASRAVVPIKKLSRPRVIDLTYSLAGSTHGLSLHLEPIFAGFLRLLRQNCEIRVSIDDRAFVVSCAPPPRSLVRATEWEQQRSVAVATRVTDLHLVSRRCEVLDPTALIRGAGWGNHFPPVAEITDARCGAYASDGNMPCEGDDGGDPTPSCDLDEVLPFLRYLYSHEDSRVDCLCNRPCEVPASPTIERSALDDGEIFSSGDELDKLESDTDSQDTVIEGEAYKRIRSVAIKEKILHANEELFGISVKEPIFESADASIPEDNSHNAQDVLDLPLFSDSEESDNASATSPFQSLYRDPEKSAFTPLPFRDKGNSTIESSSYKVSLHEVSSESSDNGSDGEEVILSDTSTSSDEATYIAPGAGFRYYRHPLPYRLHTIIEESCEEGEKSSRGSTPTGSDFEYFERRTPKKMHRKSPVGSPVLTSSRLEKYFKSGFLNRKKLTYTEDELTDESGGISSDDDDDLQMKDVSAQKLNDRKSPNKFTGAISMLADSKLKNLQECEHENYDLTSKINSKNVDIENVSDDEAKYIMNHLMQHITYNESNIESNQEINMSSLLKSLESEIARLMLTVSPASLSAGEPSSSCSSTIGSNNSDYGSDTLESGEESTSEEDINAELPSETQDINPNAECSGLDSSLPSQPIPNSENVTEETLYICKQLMASLKKIADVEGVGISNDASAIDSEDHTAKQYITDQIVSLMQTVNASCNNSPLLRRICSNQSPTINLDSDVSQDRSDSDSPPPNDEKQPSKSKTPSESGSETTISASISIPSYDDSDRTPTESEISHEMDELYALLESNGTASEMFATAKADSHSLDGMLRNADSPISDDVNFPSDAQLSSTEPSMLTGAASKLESLLPISIEERIARYKDAFLSRTSDQKDTEHKNHETRINVILPQPSISESEITTCDTHDFQSLMNKSGLSSCDNILSSYLNRNQENNYNIMSVKIVSHNTYPPSSAIHKILSNNIDSTYSDQKLDCTYVDAEETPTVNTTEDEPVEGSTIITTALPKVMNPKEKASSENDLLVANYRAKSKTNKVSGTKSVGNISELENINNKSTFRDTGYYSFKSSEESFLSLDDSTASQTSTASLTQYRSLTSTETIPEEEESNTKPVTTAKMSLSSGNIPDAISDASAAKSSTLPLSLRSKLSVTPGSNHRARSSFFSTSGVLRKLTQLRDESGNSLRSSPHGRLRMRNRSLSGGSDDGKPKKNNSLPQIAVSECSDHNTVGRTSVASSEKDSSGVQDDDIEQAFAYHSRSQMSLSSFGGRSESVTSVYSAAGGGRYGTVTVTGEVLFGLTYNYKSGCLEINVKECRNLAPVDTKRNRSDPYVKVYLLPDRTKSGKRKTKVKKHTLSPVFDELLKFQVTISELETRTLWLSVWHSDRFGRNDFLGEVMLPLGYDTLENPGLKWFPLQERLENLDAPVSYKGDLILSLKFVPPDVTSRKHSKKPGDPARGSLHVLVREARNLMATRSNGTSDPFCKSYLLPDKSKSGKQKTPVFKKSCNPNWNHTFVYDDVTIEELNERCLELTIWDYDKITSNDFLGGVRLCLGTGKYLGREVEWMDSVGEERSLWYTMLERPNTWVDGSLLLRPNMQSRKAT